MIKHIVQWNGERLHYLCIHACSVTLEKIAFDIDDVSCKNCLKIKDGE